MRHFHVSIISALLLFSSFACSRPILLEGNLDQWRHSSVWGETIYEPIMDIEQGVIIRAESQKSASSLGYHKEIDLNKTPILQWQWTAETLPYVLAVNESGIELKVTDFDEKSAEGGDFVLRIIVSRSRLFSETQSLHYVWSAHEAINSTWAINEHNKVLVVSGEGQTTMKWQLISRHVQQDWAELFGENIDSIDSVELMTDTNEIKGHAIGYYGDIKALSGKPLAIN